jgi:hypothetical protein
MAGYAPRYARTRSPPRVRADAVGLAIQGVESAAFLTEAQKRDIFFNWAAAFYRLV